MEVIKVTPFDQLVKVKKDGAVATVTLACAENNNCVNEQFAAEIFNAFYDIHYDDAIHVVVLLSEGDVFCGWGDFNYLTPRMSESKLRSRQIMERILAAVREMKDCPKPIIAAMNAPAMGGGCGFTLSSDIILSSEKGGFHPYMHATSNLIPDCGGVYALARGMNPQRALYHSLSGKPITPEEALASGLIAKIVPSEKIVDEAYELANTIASLPAYGVSNIKNLCMHIDEMDFSTYAFIEAEFVGDGIMSDDFKEVCASIAEKRTPVFTGKN